MAGNMYDFDELAAFDNVMTSGSLTHSARKLGLAKSTLSRRITQLERRLGQPLLRRQSNRLLPTEAGQAFHDYCRQILELAERGRQALDELKEEISGELQLAIHSDLARGWLTARLKQFLQRHPAVQLTLRSCSAPPTEADSQAVTVWLGDTTGSELHQEVLGWLSRGVYGQPDYLAQRDCPRHPRDLARHDWVDLLGETEQGVTFIHPQEGEFRLQPPTSRLRVDQQALHVDAIASGHGLGLLPDWLAAAQKHTQPGSLTRCLTEWHVAPTPVTLLYPYGPQPRRLCELLTFLRQAVPTEWAAQPEIALNSETGAATTAVAPYATQRCTPAL